MAAQCRHYAMCKIDFLGTGLCPSGQTKHYVSYYPQGRMDIYHALANNLIPVTQGLIDIARSCTLCGICDKQCHFVTGLRPMKVMRALKEHVESYLEENGEIKGAKEDPILDRLQGIVGEEWATKDPATLVAYANDPFPLTDMKMPRCVVLPRTRDEVVEIVQLSRRESIPYVVRGNGGSVYGAVFTDGIVIDTNRMKGIEIDQDNWTVTAQAGVTSYDLQQEVSKHGFRVNVAEPAATVCGNLVCTGIFSTWSSAYGIGADNLIDAEFVDAEGRIFHLNEKSAPNLFAFKKEVSPAPGICTQAVIPLHPVTEDEEGILIPFSSFDQALAFARNLSKRRIGLAIAVLGNHYLSTFMSPSADLAKRSKKVLQDTLGIQYTVFVIGDRYARDAIKRMTTVAIDNRALRMLMLGLPRLLDGEWIDLIEGFESDKQPFEIFCREEMYPILEAILRPSVETFSSAVDEDLKDFYRQLYSRPEMTDMVWLNSFRIVSSRMARHKHVLPFLVYVPLDRVEVIQGILSEFARVADLYGIEHAYGFLTPLDLGKRGILEYDYYIDQTDEVEKEKVRRAMATIEPFLDDLARKTKGVMGFKYAFSQGCSRKEGFLYL
jgi:hypothetical protein